MSLRGSVEAALLAAGGPVNIKDLCILVGSPTLDVEEMLGRLRTELRDKESGLEIVHSAGGMWALQVTKQYLPLVHRLVPPELDTAVLKTLSLIALLQPLPQAVLVERRGQRAYDHVRALVKKGLIDKEREGNSYRLTTTSDFARRFRLKDDPEAIKAALRERAGLASLVLDGTGVAAALEEATQDVVTALQECQVSPPTSVFIDPDDDASVVDQSVPPVPVDETASRSDVQSTISDDAEVPTPVEPDQGPVDESPPDGKITRLNERPSFKRRQLQGSDRLVATGAGTRRR